MTDRHDEKPSVIHTSSGNGSWAAVIIVALLLAAGAWYMTSGSSIPVNTPAEAPKVETPVAPAPPAEAPAPPQPAPAAPAAPAANN